MIDKEEETEMEKKTISKIFVTAVVSVAFLGSAASLSHKADASASYLTMHQSTYAYTSNGKRVKRDRYKAGSSEYFTGAKNINGQVYYRISKNRYIKANHVSVTKSDQQVTIRKKSIVYNAKGHRAHYPKLAAGDSYYVFGLTNINGQSYYQIGDGYYVKTKNTNHPVANNTHSESVTTPASQSNATRQKKPMPMNVFIPTDELDQYEMPDDTTNGNVTITNNWHAVYDPNHTYTKPKSHVTVVTHWSGTYVPPKKKQQSSSTSSQSKNSTVSVSLVHPYLDDGAKITKPVFKMPSGYTLSRMNNYPYTPASFEKAVISGYKLNPYKETQSNDKYTKVDPEHLTNWEQKELSQYALDLINQARKQIGTNQWTYTSRMQSIANDVAKEYDVDNAGISHDVPAIKRAFAKHGITLRSNTVEDLSSDYTQYYNPMTMDSLKQLIHSGICDMIFGGGSDTHIREMGHARDLLNEKFYHKNLAVSFNINQTNYGKCINVHFICWH